MTSTASKRSIVPVKLSLTEGDVYTLWAPTWVEHGSEWQAFLGDDEHILVFDSPAALLVFLESGQRHDLSTHPQWSHFAAQGDDRVVPQSHNEYDIVGAPAYLAGRASYENVSRLSGVFEIAQSMAAVTEAKDATIFFATHSVLRTVERGSESFASPQGQEEWTAVGRAVLSNWAKVVENLDQQIKIVDAPAEAELEAATERIEAAVAASAEAREQALQAHEDEVAQADPYDTSPWAAAGIDPLRITAQGTTVYTLRTYLGGQPVFLGRYGEIFTFPSTKQLLRWMLDHDEHDLARASTWEDLVAAATAGELVVSVHDDNAYSFTGLSSDIAKGPEVVDRAQMSHAYELMADAADWANDDSLNEYLLANPRFQDYLSYMLGSSESAGYVPSRPYDDKAESWKALEEMLIKRFSKF